MSHRYAADSDAAGVVCCVSCELLAYIYIKMLT